MAIQFKIEPHDPFTMGRVVAEKIVMVGGLDGCGKTLFSPIISALDRVELPTYSYEVEHYCALFFLQKMSLNSASTLVKMQTDCQGVQINI